MKSTHLILSVKLFQTLAPSKTMCFEYDSRQNYQVDEIRRSNSSNFHGATVIFFVQSGYFSIVNWEIIAWSGQQRIRKSVQGQSGSTTRHLEYHRSTGTRWSFESIERFVILTPGVTWTLHFPNQTKYTLSRESIWIFKDIF